MPSQRKWGLTQICCGKVVIELKRLKILAGLSFMLDMEQACESEFHNKITNFVLDSKAECGYVPWKSSFINKNMAFFQTIVFGCFIVMLWAHETQLCL